MKLNELRILKNSSLLEELNIEATHTDMDDWFKNDGPGYEHLSDRSIVDHVSKPARDAEADNDEEDDVQIGMQNVPRPTNKPWMPSTLALFGSDFNVNQRQSSLPCWSNYANLLLRSEKVVSKAQLSRIFRAKKTGFLFADF